MRRHSRWALLVLTFVGAAALAQDATSTPFPGITRTVRTLADQSIHIAVVDLCAAGVSARATAFSERRRTTSGFGSLVGAQLAINGDFVDPQSGWTRVDGLAMSSGALWPQASDTARSSAVMFGANKVQVFPDVEVTALPDWAREIVSGHPTVLTKGTAVGDADPGCQPAARTGLGLSLDKKRLILVVADGGAPGKAGLRCSDLAALLKEFGAHDGTSLGGGGESTMWLAGAGVVNAPVGAEQLVANHLAIFAKGSGPSPHCPPANRPPRGTLDSAKCEALKGWAQDPDVKDDPINVHLYFDGPPGTSTTAISVKADKRREDLCGAIGSCNHGFDVPIPLGIRDNASHTVAAWAIDSAGGGNPQLPGEFTLTCSGDLPQGVRRHILNPASLQAWKLENLFKLCIRPNAEQLAARSEGPKFPLTPKLIKGEGAAEVYVEDASFRRELDAATAATWGLDLTKAQTVTAAELAALPEGPAWRPSPELAAFEGYVYAMDDVLMPIPPKPPKPVDAGVVLPSTDAGTTIGPAETDGGTGGGKGPAQGGCAASPGAASALCLALLALLALRRR